MSAEDFNSLNIVEQKSILFFTAVFISNHVSDNIIADIYHLDNFFVECCYKLNDDAKAKITAHHKLEDLPSLEIMKPPAFSDN